MELKGLMKQFGIDPEELAKDFIKDTLADLSEELNCTEKDFFVMIKPADEKFNFKMYVYKLENGTPKLVRELTTSELTGKSKDE